MPTLAEFYGAHNGSHVIMNSNSIPPTPELSFLLYKQNLLRRVEFSKAAAAAAMRVVSMLKLVEFYGAHNVIMNSNSIPQTPELSFLLYKQNVPKRVEFSL